MIEGDDIGDAPDVTHKSFLLVDDFGEDVGFDERRFNPFFAVAPSVEFASDREVDFIACLGQILLGLLLHSGISV